MNFSDIKYKVKNVQSFDNDSLTWIEESVENILGKETHHSKSSLII